MENELTTCGSAIDLFERGLEIGQKGQDLQAISSRKGESSHRPFLVIGKDQKVEDLTPLMLPARAFRHSFDEVDSFIDFVKYYKEEWTRLYCVESNGAFRAVIDEHPAASQGRVIVHERAMVGDLTLAKTPEWEAWSGKIGKGLGQFEFAIFLEDNGRFVVAPSAADFMQVALTLEAKKGVNFKSGMRLENGDHKLVFEEDTISRAGAKGDMEIPHDFSIKLKLYHGGEPVQLDGKLRYRIQSGQIQFFYKFPGLENVVRQYVSGIRKRIVKETGLPVWSMHTLE